MQLLINPKNQFLDNNGDPLAGGKLYFYEAGTTTPTDTYTDQAGGTSNTNPLILDSSGRGEAWLDPAVSYKVRLTDADDVQIWEVDNIEYLPDGFVTTAKLNDLAVTTAKLAASAVTTAKIADLGVTTAKIANSAVTAAKLEDRNLEISSTSTGSFSTTSTSLVDVTNATVDITTRGRPVLLSLQPDGASQGYIGGLSSTADQLECTYVLQRDGVTIASYSVELIAERSSGGTQVRVEVPPNIFYIDQPTSGSYTYKVQAVTAAFGYTTTVYAANLKLVAVEL